MDTALATAIAALTLVLILAFVIVAFVQVQRDRGLDRLSHALWSVGILLFPLVGALAWYLLRQRQLVTLAAIRGALVSR